MNFETSSHATKYVKTTPIAEPLVNFQGAWCKKDEPVNENHDLLLASNASYRGFLRTNYDKNENRQYHPVVILEDSQLSSSHPLTSSHIRLCAELNTLPLNGERLIPNESTTKHIHSNDFEILVSDEKNDSKFGETKSARNIKSTSTASSASNFESDAELTDAELKKLLNLTFEPKILREFLNLKKPKSETESNFSILVVDESDSANSSSSRQSLSSSSACKIKDSTPTVQKEVKLSNSSENFQEVSKVTLQQTDDKMCNNSNTYLLERYFDTVFDERLNKLLAKFANKINMSSGELVTPVSNSKHQEVSKLLKEKSEKPSTYELPSHIKSQATSGISPKSRFSGFKEKPEDLHAFNKIIKRTKINPSNKTTNEKWILNNSNLKNDTNILDKIEKQLPQLQETAKKIRVTKPLPRKAPHEKNSQRPDTRSKQAKLPMAIPKTDLALHRKLEIREKQSSDGYDETQMSLNRKLTNSKLDRSNAYLHATSSQRKMIDELVKADLDAILERDAVALLPMDIDQESFVDSTQSVKSRSTLKKTETNNKTSQRKSAKSKTHKESAKGKSKSGHLRRYKTTI